MFLVSLMSFEIEQVPRPCEHRMTDEVFTQDLRDGGAEQNFAGRIALSRLLARTVTCFARAQETSTRVRAKSYQVSCDVFMRGGEVITRACRDIRAAREARHVRVQGHHAGVRCLHARVKALHAPVQPHHAGVKNASRVSRWVERLE
jgi:hypothetical protein